MTSKDETRFLRVKLEPIIQSEVSQKEKHQYSVLMHILEKEMEIHSHILA